MIEIVDGHRTAWLEIDLGAIRHNIGLIRGLVGGAAVAPVVKANAYGHGIEAVARAIEDASDAICVATLDEAMSLRQVVVSGRIIVLYPIPAASAATAMAARLELTIMDGIDLEALQASATTGAPSVGLHVCVETGLGRGGLAREAVAPIVASATADPRFHVAGLWTHLASPEDGESSAEQVRRLEAASATLAAAGLPMPHRHVAASGAILGGLGSAFDLVRPGLAAYGVIDDAQPVSAEAASTAAQLRPAMALKARAVAFVDVAPGEGVGYGGTWRAERPSRVAILPLGYGDGYLRSSQPGAAALVRGRRVPLVGAISMDGLAVDVTDLPGVDGADELVLLGRQGDEAITAAELARGRNTIAWEVLSAMAPRLARVYHP